jgi:hypothetical protein
MAKAASLPGLGAQWIERMKRLALASSPLPIVCAGETGANRSLFVRDVGRIYTILI